MPAPAALTTLGGLLTTNAPAAAPQMITNSVGCHSSIRCPPPSVKPKSTLTSTTTLPIIKNMREARVSGQCPRPRRYRPGRPRLDAAAPTIPSTRGALLQVEVGFDARLPSERSSEPARLPAESALRRLPFHAGTTGLAQFAHESDHGIPPPDGVLPCLHLRATRAAAASNLQAPSAQ